MTFALRGKGVAQMKICSNLVREVAWNLYCTAVPMRTGGRGRRGFMRSEKFADVIYGWHPETREETVGRHLSVDLNHL